MSATPKIVNTRMIFPDVQRRASRSDRGVKLLRTIVGSGVASLITFVVIVVSLPLTNFSMSGLFVSASIVALAIFLLILLLRYLFILGMAFLFETRYTVEERDEYSPFVSIIVPVYNEGKVLRSSIDSLLQLDYENYEIIIVNDGSTDESREVAASLVGYRKGTRGPVCVTLINKPNGGKATALNVGIQYSQADFVLCMDGDSELSPDTLKMAVRHFADPGVGAVAGNVKVLNRDSMITTLQALEYVEGLNMARSAQSHVGTVNIIPGPIGIFRKEAIRGARWYSSDTFAEDADLTLNLRLAGWEIRYEPNAISYTEAPATMQQLLKQRYRWTRGILQSIRKHKKHLINPTLRFRHRLVLWSLFYEAIIWPTMNIFANAFFIVIALAYGMSNTIALWWAGIALLDVMTALYCVAVEKEEFKLIPYAFVYRLIFILLIDITKVAATVEEFLGIEMNWGKLERIGTART